MACTHTACTIGGVMQPGAGTTVERQVEGEFGDRSPVLNQTKPSATAADRRITQVSSPAWPWPLLYMRALRFLLGEDNRQNTALLLHLSGRGRRRLPLLPRRTSLSRGQSLAMLVAALGLLAALPPLPPPPPPNSPGYGCSGETVFPTDEGSHVFFFSSGSSSLRCSFVIHTNTPGLLVTLNRFRETSCTSSTSNVVVQVYDSTLALERLLAHFTCTGGAWPVASTGSSVMMTLAAPPSSTGTFNLTWTRASPTCGNGLCEGSADEYDTCPLDCSSSLPLLSLQHHDTKCVTRPRSLSVTTICTYSVATDARLPFVALQVSIPPYLAACCIADAENRITRATQILRAQMVRGV